MAYIKTVWEDFPSENTPISASALQNIEDGIETLDTAYSDLLNFFYPVGTIYETTSTDLDTTTKMANYFGGTWEVFGAGRVLVGYNAGETEFNTIGKTGGHKQLQSHKHGILVLGQGGSSACGIQVQSSGANGNFNALYSNDAGTGDSGNLQPYIVVYRYRRTA